MYTGFDRIKWLVLLRQAVGLGATQTINGCHHGHLRRWADTGLCVAVCILAKKFLRRPKTTFACLTQSQAISQSIAFLSLLRSMRGTNKFYLFFRFFRNSFYRFLYHGNQIISWWRICRWLVVNFEIYLCGSGVNSDLGECFFGGLCKPVIAPTDLWPQETKMHANGRWLAWTCLKAVSVPFRRATSFVMGGLGGGGGLHTHVPLVAVIFYSQSPSLHFPDHIWPLWCVVQISTPIQSCDIEDDRTTLDKKTQH